MQLRKSDDGCRRFLWTLRPAVDVPADRLTELVIELVKRFGRNSAAVPWPSLL